MSLSAVDESHMQAAFRLALKSRAEGGCPIGAVLVDQASGAVLGQGHNALVQEGNTIVPGEMAALRAAGRLTNRHRTTLYTTLQPCFMCAGTIAQFGIPRVVIGDVENASSDETLRFLRARGVEVVVLEPADSPAAHACVELVKSFRTDRPAAPVLQPEVGPNPALVPHASASALRA